MVKKQESPYLTTWARELIERFRSGSYSQFLIYGNVNDVYPYTDLAGRTRFLSLKEYLDDVILESYDTVIHYDRGRGIQASRGDMAWAKWVGSGKKIRDPDTALEFIDGYLFRALNLKIIQALDGNKEKTVSCKIAVILDYAQFIVPHGSPTHLSGQVGSHIVKTLSWANDPSILKHNILTVLIAERLNDVNRLVTENPRCSKINVLLPDREEMDQYLDWLKCTRFADLDAQGEIGPDGLSRRLTGMNRIAAGNVVSYALHNGKRLNSRLLSRLKKESIEEECQGLLEFIESPYSLDDVAGHEAAKTWLKEDARLLRDGKSHALPMGYLITGRSGTGKTFLVTCWAGELGVPCVILKNFRDKWVGATESNLEKIFAILRALGQVVVFVDEADQMAGRRQTDSSDSGLSGRVYAQLAKEMSDTRNRGTVIWVFATSRPDLLEVDLKRQGRLDVHIPLFPPQSEAEYRQLFLAAARKLGVVLKEEDVPMMPGDCAFGGNEIEGIVVRGARIYELESDPPHQRPLADILSQVVKEVSRNHQSKQLEYMDLVAVRECTDGRFLTSEFRDLSQEELTRRIDALRSYI